MSEKEINSYGNTASSNMFAEIYVREIKHTMDCEGLPLTKQDEQDIEDVLRGRRTAKEIKEAFLKENGLL